MNQFPGAELEQLHTLLVETFDEAEFRRFVRFEMGIVLAQEVSTAKGTKDIFSDFLEKLSNDQLGLLLRKLILHFADRPNLKSACENWLNLLPPGAGVTLGKKPNNLPYRSIGTLFKGREQFLEALKEKLVTGNTHAVGVLAAQTIHGLGGVGKTRAAVEFAWRHQADFSALLFVTADSPANLERNLAGLVEPLVLDLKEAQATNDQTAQMAAALQWLQTHDRWFLILDNVDDEATAKVVQEQIAHLTQGRILITSRLARWSKGVETLALDVLAAEDACQFLLERTAHERQPQPDDAARGLALAHDLDGLALALEQAGAYIVELGLSFEQYQRRWQQQRDKVLAWYDERVMEYPRSLAVTWETSFQQLTPAARTLLEHLRWLGPEPIPQFLFDDVGPGRIDPADENIEDLWQELLGDDVLAAVGNLARYSLLKRDVTATVPTVVVHRLVQEITRRRIPPADRHRNWSQCVTALDSVLSWEQTNPEHSREWNAMAAHVEHVVEHSQQFPPSQTVSTLLEHLSAFYFSQQLFQSAERAALSSLAVEERHDAPVNTRLASRESAIGAILRRQGRLRESQQHLNRAVILQKTETRLTPELATFYSNLAAVCTDLKEWEQAESYIRSAQELLLVLPEQLPHLRSVCDGVLAVIRRGQNRIADAIEIEQKALARISQTLGEECPEYANRCHQLALYLEQDGQLTEAEALLKKALQIAVNKFGPQHANTASRSRTLGVFYHRHGNYELAVHFAETALNIDLLHGERDLLALANNYNNLAMALEGLGKLPEAEAFMENAMQLTVEFEQKHAHTSPDHDKFCKNQNNLRYRMLLASDFKQNGTDQSE